MLLQAYTKTEPGRQAKSERHQAPMALLRSDSSRPFGYSHHLNDVRDSWAATWTEMKQSWQDKEDVKHLLRYLDLSENAGETVDSLAA